MGMVFRHSGEYALYYGMSAAQKAQWAKWSGNNPKGTFDNWLSKYGPPLGLPARAPASAPGDLPGAAPGSPGGPAAGGAPPAFTPDQQKDYNKSFWDILYGGQDNEHDWANTVLNDKTVRDAMDLNFKKARSVDADEESARGLTATGYAFHHFADLNADFERDAASQASVFSLAQGRYNANIARFNSALSQLGEEGNIAKFLNVGDIAAGTAGTGAVAAGTAPKNLNAPAAAPLPGIPPAATNPNPASEGYGNPQFDPKAAPKPAGPPPHQPAPAYATNPVAARTKLNAVEYSKRLKSIRDRHGAGSKEVQNYRDRNYY